MKRSCRPAFLRAALALALALLILPSASAGQTAPAADGAVRDYAPAMKRQQQRNLMRGAKRRMEAARALAKLRRAHPELAKKKGTGLKPARDWGEGGGPQGIAGVTAPSTRAALPAAAQAALQPNVRFNNPAGDDPNSAQAEQWVVAQGPHLLAAWNDFPNLSMSVSTQGYGWSVDGGVTWHDGGPVPAPAGWKLTSDPVIAVNEKTGDFWYCGMADDVGGTANGIAVVKANFVADTVQWGAGTIIRSGNNNQFSYDKPWIAVDSLNNRVYVTYSLFSSRLGTMGDDIYFQRSAVGGGSWGDAPVLLSSDAEFGYVQGSRPVAGPNGEIYVVWYSINGNPPVDPYSDWMKVRKSTTQGASWASAVTAATLFSNYGSGAPGFNRETGITFPSIAVDRSSGAHRGRVYVAWNESIDFFDDALGAMGRLAETEPNDAPASADTFSIGRTISGSVSAPSDLDFWKFHGTAGQTIIVFADSTSSTLDMSMRLYCTDGTTRLAFSAPGMGQSNLLVFTLPETGDYYLRMTSYVSSTGNYRIVTGFDTPSPLKGERARDHRDAFVTWSDDGTTWSTPARASDSPANYDDWLPEVTVAGDNTDPRVGSGQVYCLWYDWRDSPAGTCGGVSNVYLSRSADGGGTWAPVGLVSDAQTAWTNVASNIIPNQGDYVALFADGTNVYTAWADGRNGNPDVYGAIISLVTTPVQVSLASAQAGPDHVTLAWYVGGLPGVTASVERRDEGSGFSFVGEAVPDGADLLVFTDRAVIPGTRYAYRLAWIEGGVRHTSPEVWVDVPSAPTFALEGARPNPAVNGVFVSLSLPDAAPATLELLDVSGRRVATKALAGPGTQLVNMSEGRALEPGLYLVRLTQGGRSLTAHVVVMR